MPLTEMVNLLIPTTVNADVRFQMPSDKTLSDRRVHLAEAPSEKEDPARL
jgi:hypothetical protein